jgi:steroid delta-isomerase-like uncharacterized protein
LNQFCQEWLAAWTGNQPELLLSFYSEDAFYSDPGRPEGLRGRKSLLPYFQKLLSKNPEWVWKALEVIPTEKGFTLKWEATIPLKDKVVKQRGVDIVEFKDGKISRNEVYFDPSLLKSTKEQAP